MDRKGYFLLAALCAQSVLGSYYHGPTAEPLVLGSGYLADTLEVAAAKGAHLAAPAKESHYGHRGDYSGPYAHGGDYLSYSHGRAVQYHGPTAKPVVLKSGYLADTHEVAAAKGAHLAALAKESHNGRGGGYSGSSVNGGDYLSYSHGRAVQYHGPTARPVVLKSGYLADTHEVAAAKDAHLAALSTQSHYGQGGEYRGPYARGGDYLSYSPGHVTKYHGPTTKPEVLKSGYLADTLEVAAAKGAHLAALAKESHYGPGGGYSESYINGSDYSGSYGYEADYAHAYSHGYAAKYHGPTAIPHVLKSGYLADTHEVAAAKDAHIAALSAQSQYGHSGEYRGSYAHGGDYSGAYGDGGDYLPYGPGHVTKYHGSTAKPVVLESGYLADTHEVAAAKGAHLAALAKESHYGHSGDHSESHGYGREYYGSSHGHGYDIKYHVPTAVPHVLKNGHIADTHEVAAAKVEHYSAVAEAKHHDGYGYGHGYSQRYSGY